MRSPMPASTPVSILVAFLVACSGDGVLCVCAQAVLAPPVQPTPPVSSTQPPSPVQSEQPPTQPPSPAPPLPPPPDALPPSALPSPPSALDARQVQKHPEEVYLAILREYASGGYDAAVAALTNVPRGRLDDRVFGALQEAMVRPLASGTDVLGKMNPEQRRKVAGDWARFVPAAALMHLETGHLHLIFRATGVGLDHLVMARTLMDWEQWTWIVAQRPETRQPYAEMRRNVYLAMAWTLQQFELFGALQSHLRKARDEFPNDAEVLLASGSAEEILAKPTVVNQELRVHPTSEVWLVAQRRALRQSHLEKAEEYHRAAVQADPTLAEAHMRLGRVLQERHKWAEARRSLETARDLKPPSDIGYLAALFLAALTEEEGDEPSAFAQYGAITRRWPDCQAAHLSLSRGYEARGDRQAALGALQPLWRPAKARACPRDPWWIYGLGQAWRLRAHIEALRAQVRS